MPNLSNKNNSKETNKNSNDNNKNSKDIGFDKISYKICQPFYSAPCINEESV